MCQCACAVDGDWQRTSTSKRDLGEAKKQVHEILVEAKYHKKINQAPIPRQFKGIAKDVVKRMADELAAGGGKSIFKDCMKVLNKYLVPLLGKYKIDSIDDALPQKNDGWRLKRREKEPAYPCRQRQKNEHCPAFTLEEVGAMRNNFDARMEMAAISPC